MELTRVCIVCGADISDRKPHAIVCRNPACKNRYKVDRKARIRNENKPITKRECIVCGTDISNRPHHAVICLNPACKNKHKADLSAKIRHENKIIIKRECPYCGKDISEKPAFALICGSDECKKARESNRYRKRTGVKPLVKCAFCGQLFEKTSANKCCSPECAKLRKQYMNRKSRIEDIARHPRNEEIETDDEAFKKNSLNIYDSFNPDYFDNSMFKQKLKDSNKKNGWFCRECGRELRGNNRCFCHRCYHYVKNQEIRMDNDWLYYN